jgi:hypothetical protein
MALTLELPKEVEAALRDQAQVHGMTVEGWLLLSDEAISRESIYPDRV